MHGAAVPLPATLGSWGAGKLLRSRVAGAVRGPAQSLGYTLECAGVRGADPVVLSLLRSALGAPTSRTQAVTLARG